MSRKIPKSHERNSKDVKRKDNGDAHSGGDIGDDIGVDASIQSLYRQISTNTRQASYFEGTWRIESKTNAKIEVRKQYESFRTIRRVAIGYVCHTCSSNAVNSK